MVLYILCYFAGQIDGNKYIVSCCELVQIRKNIIHYLILQNYYDEVTDIIISIQLIVSPVLMYSFTLDTKVSQYNNILCMKFIHLHQKCQVLECQIWWWMSL